MKMGDAVVLVMKKQLVSGMELDEKKYLCHVCEYDTKKERIYLVLENDILPSISLDAVYECNVKTKEGVIVCNGRVIERYCTQSGKVITFQIKNGFYKISVKSVDK